MIDTARLLSFPSDRPIRRRYCTPASYAHPAKMHCRLLLWLVERYSQPGDTICDPMYGIGTTGLAALSQRNVIGYEIEPRYLAEAHRNAALVLDGAGMFAGRITVAAHDARESWPHRADVVLLSPPYGCAMSPHAATRRGILNHRLRLHGEKKLSERWAQLIRQGENTGALGAEFFHYGEHPAQIGHLRGDRYWREMTAVYTQARAALRPGGLLILIIKDHIRDGARVHVAGATARLCETLGFRLAAQHARRVWPLSLWQRRRKEQGQPIVEDESIIVMEAT
jgi:predicted RNA methylase